ncbi:MAG: leucine-rich repeat domain-containing protein [Clostridia bacterium]|nr:leucine-rich repeat domain-containing protein [Clostridia bacterium]
MKRKLLVILLGAIAVFACAFGFAGCDLFDTGDTDGGNNGGNKECVHTIIHCPAKEATCKETGNTEFWYCNSCGKYFSDESGKNQIAVRDTTLEKTGHREITDAAVKATCTTAGKTAGKHCIVCNTVTLEQKVIPAGHTIVIDEAIEATCTTTGKTEGKHCSVCKTVILSQHIVEPLSHKVVTDSAVEATCTEDGKTEGSHCSACNEVFITQEIIPAGHTEVTDARVDATCTEDGKTEGKHCSRCNEVLVAQTVIVKTGHTKVVDPAVEATCSAVGKTQGEHCSACNTVFTAQQIIEKLPHSGNGNLCSVCGGLRVAASTELTFKELTALPGGVSAHSDEVNVIGYEVTGHVGAPSGILSNPDLVIPETYNGKPVLGIGSNAFYQCNLTSITIPSSVIYIGSYAFAYNTRLSEVIIADSVTAIKDGAFRGAPITTFKCPKNLKAIEAKTFVNCTNLVSVIVNENLTSFDTAAFGDNPAIENIFFEGTRTQWNDASRSWNGSKIWGYDNRGNVVNDLYSVTINFYSETQPTKAGNYWHYDENGNPALYNGIITESIGLTFRGVNRTNPLDYTETAAATIIGYEVTGRGTCTDADIVIPTMHEGLPVYGLSGAFKNDTTLRSIIVPNGVKYINDGFMNCTNLVSVDLADSVVNISFRSFEDCSSLTSFKSPANLVEITDVMFLRCTSLEWVIINPTAKRISPNPFTGCGKVMIYFYGTEQQWNDMGGADLFYPDYMGYEHLWDICFYAPNGYTAVGNYWHYDENENPVKW